MKRANGAVAAALVLAMMPTLAQASASAAPRVPVRIRATVESYDRHSVTVKTDRGDHLTLERTPHTGFATVEPRRLSDLAVNAYVGVTALPGSDCKLHATRVYIFPATMRGAGEGHFPGREGRDSATVNATVTAVASMADGETITLHFKSKASGKEGRMDRYRCRRRRSGRCVHARRRRRVEARSRNGHGGAERRRRRSPHMP